MFQANVAWGDRRLTSVVLRGMKLMTLREPSEQYKAIMISAKSIHESDVIFNVSKGHLHFSQFEV